MTAHPGRMALLRRAAYGANVTSKERDELIRIAAHGWPRERALQVLQKAAEAHQERRGTEASRLLNSLLEPPPEQGAPDE